MVVSSFNSVQSQFGSDYDHILVGNTNRRRRPRLRWPSPHRRRKRSSRYPAGSLLKPDPSGSQSTMPLSGQTCPSRPRNPRGACSRATASAPPLTPTLSALQPFPSPRMLGVRLRFNDLRPALKASRLQAGEASRQARTILRARAHPNASASVESCSGR